MSKRVIAGIILLLVVAAGAFVLWRSRAPKPEEKPAAESTAKVERGDLRVTVSAAGVLEPLTTVEVKSRAGGEITRIYVEPGDYVHRGDLIAQLDPTQVNLQVAQARAQVDSARAGLGQASLQASSQAVASQTTLQQAQAAVETAQARLKQAQEQYQMTRVSADQEVRQARASLEAAEARLAEARAQAAAQPALSSAAVEQAKSDLRAAEQSLQELLAGNRPEEIARARAAVDSAQARADNARATLQRQQELLSKGFVSQQAVDDAQAAYDSALAALQSAQADLTLAQQGPRPEEIERARAQVERARAAVRSAEANMVNVDLRAQEVAAAEAAVRQAAAAVQAAEANRAQVQVRAQELAAARAALREAQASLTKARSGNLEVEARRKQVAVAAAALSQAQAKLADVAYDSANTTIVAPRDGVVLSKPVEEGTVIPGGTSATANAPAIVVLADITDMYVTAQVDESDIGQVKEEMPATVQVDVLPNKKLRGRVEKIYPEPKTEGDVVSYEVRVQLLETAEVLRPGMTADVEILIADLKNVLLVPDAAITHGPGGPTVQVMQQGKPVERKIVVGLTDWNNTEVKQGLAEGEEVLLPSPGPLAGAGGPGGGPGGPPGRGATGAERSRNVSRQMRMLSPPR